MKITLLEYNFLILKYFFLIEGISNSLVEKLHPFIKSEVKVHPLENLRKEYALSTRDTLRASKYIVTSTNSSIHEKNVIALEKLRIALQSSSSKNIHNLIPEVYKRDITCEMTLKDLKKLITLRDIDASLYEEKELARLLFKALPKEHRNLLEENKE